MYIFHQPLYRENYNEDFSFDCGNTNIVEEVIGKMSEDVKSEWYTVCGKPHSDHQSFVGVIAALASISIPTYSYAFLF